MRGRYQGGSLAGFIIVGVLLAIVVVGGLYGLNRYNAQKAGEVATNDEPAEEQPARQEESTRDSDKDPIEQTQRGTDSNARDEEKKEEAANADAGTSSSTGAATTANLPQTGPADTLLQLVALGVLSFSVAHYVQSRRTQ